ncbi:MAG: type II secretion system F family protein [Gemmataceae bacterium]|nr:type II secretion system F family protein [Gemmataceae bacterium]
MLISNTIPPASWAQTFRMVRIGLDAGLPVVRVFRQQSERGPTEVRPMMDRIATQLNDGSTLADALEPERGQLPAIVTPLLAVGEEAGRLGDTLRELEHFFDQQASLRREFRAQMAWPVFQFFAAVGVIALFLLVLGWLDIKLQPLGPLIGTGAAGAARWLMLVFGCLFIGWSAYRVLTRQARFLAPVERALLKLPMIGPAFQNILLTRFCIALKLTLGSGLPVKRAVRLSCDAVGSRLFSAAYSDAKPELARGATLTETLRACRVFPGEMLDAVAVGEESGQIPEVMGRQAEMYRELATMQMRLLVQAGGWFVYGCVALMIIVLIFTIYSSAIAPNYKF